MTERLSQLLHDEADRLDIPAPAADAALTRGRGLRRRRTAAAVGAVATALVVIGGVALLAADGGDERAVEPADGGADGLAFAVGTTIYYDSGQESATIDDKAVKSLYYTSGGVLVRHGNNPWSDGGGPQRFSLVEPDGNVRPISVVTEETVHSADPKQPYLAYTETTGDTTEVVVWDLTDDTEEARIALPAGLSWGGWEGPPVSLSGDLVYVGTDDVARVVNWRTGEVTETDAISPGFPEVLGGRATSSSEARAAVLDVASGEVLLEVDGEYPSVGLSPGGRFATITPEMRGMPSEAGGETFEVYDIDSGGHVTMPGNAYDYGWSPDGKLFRVDGHDLITCSPTSGACETTALQLELAPSTSGEGVLMKCDKDGRCVEIDGPEDFSAELKLGGRVYES